MTFWMIFMAYPSALGADERRVLREARPAVVGSGNVPRHRHGRGGDHRRQQHSSCPHGLLLELDPAFNVALRERRAHRPIAGTRVGSGRWGASDYGLLG